MLNQRIFLSLFLSLLFLVGNVKAQMDLSGKLAFNPDVTVGEFDNGLKYYIKENKKASQHDPPAIKDFFHSAFRSIHPVAFESNAPQRLLPVS